MTTVEDRWIGAACREPDVDPGVFFPPRGDDRGEAAKRICRACPIQQKCGEFIMEWESRPGVAGAGRFGVWAGMTPRDRQRLALRKRLES